MPDCAAEVPEPGRKHRDALDFFREYREDVQQILRNPGLLTDKEEWGSFKTLISHLDDALAASALSSEMLLFHGMNRDIAHNFLFMLDVKEEGDEEEVDTRLIPHLIQDPAFTLFSPDPAAVLRELPGVEQETRVLLALRGNSGDPAVVIDGQVLYPRNTIWITTGATRIRLERTPVVIVGIEMGEFGEA